MKTAHFTVKGSNYAQILTEIEVYLKDLMGDQVGPHLIGYMIDDANIQIRVDSEATMMSGDHSIINWYADVSVELP